MVEAWDNSTLGKEGEGQERREREVYLVSQRCHVVGALQHGTQVAQERLAVVLAVVNGERSKC